MTEIIKKEQRKIFVVASAALTLLLVIQAAPTALAETLFSFHIDNLESGKNVMFTMTNLYTGQYQWHTQYIVPSVDDTVLISSFGGFPSGEPIKGCIIDLDTRAYSCDTINTYVNPVPFYVSA